MEREGMNAPVKWEFGGKRAQVTALAALFGNSKAITVAVNHTLSSIEHEWREFQTVAAGSFYQTFEWCSAWIETAGRAEGAKACVVTGWDSRGRLQFLLPFAVRTSNGARILEWIGSSQINYGYGLYDREFLPTAREWFGTQGWRIISEVGDIDAIRLKELPESLHGHPHPLVDWRTVRGANRSYTMALRENYEELYAEKRSSDTRRGNRKRDAKLEKIGDVQFGLPDSREQTHALLEQMFKHQESRLAENGIRGVFGPADREFVHRLGDMEGVLLPYHLSVDGELAAMMLGGIYDNTFWALISSLNSGVARKYSPGDAALRRMIEACCKSGLKRLDFSSGDTSYKLHWADEAIPLHEAIHFVTLKGAFWAAGAVTVAFGKRMIKQSPTLWPVFTWLRAALHSDTQKSQESANH